MGQVQGRPLSGALRIGGLTVRFGPVTVLKGLDLSVESGELFVLLGGSGSGKTTLLRAIAGFVKAEAGSIELDGADLVPLPPHKRPVNTVFQSGALFPHLSVAANIAFGPRQLGRPKTEVDETVRGLLSLVHMDEFGARRPHQLSGGQRQRVALARGLAARPSLLLLDEPLSALDRGLRAETAAELVRLQKRLGTTFVLVTHDQTEALTMATRIGVMHLGGMEQVGTPREIYERPASRFVAEFMGVANIFNGMTDGSVVHALGQAIRLDRPVPPGPCALAVRAERVMLTEGPNQMEGVLAETSYAGDMVSHTVRVAGDMLIKVTEPPYRDRAIGQTVTLSLPPDACLVLPP